jgi:hypothetical protein
MNSDTVPTISTAWERVIDGEIERVFDLSLSNFSSFTKEYISEKLPFDSDELRKIILAGKRKA